MSDIKFSKKLNIIGETLSEETVYIKAFLEIKRKQKESED